MKLGDFDYPLPPDRIAQRPLPHRDDSRLLVLLRPEGLEEAVFHDLPRFLDPGDLLVVNDVKVAPLRLRAQKTTGARLELTLVRPLSEPGRWECLIKGRGLRPGDRLELEAGEGVAVLEAKSGGEVRVDPERGAPLWRVRIETDDVGRLLASRGLVPLPPYIKRPPAADSGPDRDRYQTVYATGGQAAAAPTAGLHFTPALLAALEQKGVGVARLRLEVSYGTFAPVRTERVEDHRVHPERFELPEATAAAVEGARRAGRRVVAVGTTVVRVLESRVDPDGALRPGRGETNAYIYPGHRFKAVDALVTNFHMPRSTLLLLVAAFAGTERVLAAYRHALDHGFRFLSYGDAMLIL